MLISFTIKQSQMHYLWITTKDSLLKQTHEVSFPNTKYLLTFEVSLLNTLLKYQCQSLTRDPLSGRESSWIELDSIHLSQNAEVARFLLLGCGGGCQSELLFQLKLKD